MFQPVNLAILPERPSCVQLRRGKGDATNIYLSAVFHWQSVGKHVDNGSAAWPVLMRKVPITHISTHVWASEYGAAR